MQSTKWSRLSCRENDKGYQVLLKKQPGKISRLSVKDAFFIQVCKTQFIM
jgi:hypothetical protein